jgi:hypothetical protein
MRLESLKMFARNPSPRPWKETLAAGLLLAAALALAYGPAKLAGHSIYGGVIQDLTNLYGFFCWDEFSRSELLAGRFPLWNPHNAFGVPHLANMQTAVFYPVNWLKWAFGFWPVIDLILMLRLWLAGIFTYLLARASLRVGLFPALLAAIAFMLGGHLTRYVYMSHLNVEVLLPLQALLMHRLARRACWTRLLAAAGGFALLTLGGFPEATLWAIALTLAYYLFCLGRDLPRRCWAGAAALALGLIVAAPQWLPFAEYLPQAWTYHDATSGLRHCDPRLAVALVLPWFFGDNRLSPVASFLPPYLGLVPVLLIVYLALAPRRIGRTGAFWLAAAVTLAAVIYGVPPFSLLGRIFPFSLTYNDKYAAPALGLSVALLAGLAAHRIAAGRSLKNVTVAVLVLVGSVAANVGMGYANLFRPVWALGLKYSPAMLPIASALLAAAIVIVLLRQRLRIRAAAAAAGLALLTLLGLLADQRGYAPLYHDGLRPQSAALAKLLPPGDTQLRVHADPELTDLLADRLLPAGIDDLRSYDPLYPRRYVEFMARVNGLAGDTLREHYDRNMLFSVDRAHLADPMLALANVGYFLLPTALDEVPLARGLVETARTLSPRAESWLRAEETSAAGVFKLALMEHAPIRIETELARPASGTPTLMFEAGVPDGQWSRPGGPRGDGLDFAVIALDNPPRLRYARYLDAKRRPDDFGWKPVSLPLPPPLGAGNTVTVALSILPGPKNDSTRDAAAWGQPRLKAPTAPSGLTRIGSGGDAMFLYRSERVYPRFGWVRGAGPLPEDEAGYQAGVARIAQVNLNAFKSVALIKGELNEPLSGATVKVDKESLTVTDRVPGRTRYAYTFSHPRIVVQADQDFPGFRAWTTSGAPAREVRVRLADGAFMAAAAQAGPGELELAYQPWAFRIGLWFALAGLAVAMVLSGPALVMGRVGVKIDEG